MSHLGAPGVVAINQPNINQPVKAKALPSTSL